MEWEFTNHSLLSLHGAVKDSGMYVSTLPYSSQWKRQNNYKKLLGSASFLAIVFGSRCFHFLLWVWSFHSPSDLWWEGIVNAWIAHVLAHFHYSAPFHGYCAHLNRRGLPNISRYYNSSRDIRAALWHACVQHHLSKINFPS